MLRIGLAFVLATVTLGLPLRVHAQGLDLASVVLTESDVPSGLRLSRDHSGAQERNGAPGYQVTFEADPSQVGPGSGGIAVVMNLVALPSDPVAGLDEISQSAKQSLPGTATDLAPPAVGEESRAFTSNAGFGPFAMTVATTTFRRNGVVAGVTVMSAGGQPQIEQCLRLAQIVDSRLMAAGNRSGT